jgi:hypothetical protein
VIEFMIGLWLGLLVAVWVKRRSNADTIRLNKSIYAGDAVPDENGYIGWVIK